MTQLGMVLSEDDVHAMMKSVGIGPHGKISYAGTSLYTRTDCHLLTADVATLLLMSLMSGLLMSLVLVL